MLDDAALATDLDALSIRGKNQTFALEIVNSNRVTLQGLNFFATTFLMWSCFDCAVLDAALDYPSYSRRALGEVAPRTLNEVSNHTSLELG